MVDSLTFVIIFGIFFFVLLLIIILFIPNNSLMISSTSSSNTKNSSNIKKSTNTLTETSTNTVTPVLSGTFDIIIPPTPDYLIYDGPKDGLFNILNFSTNIPDGSYIIQSGSYGDAWNFRTPGKYSIEVTFNILTQNYSGNVFTIYTTICFTSTFGTYLAYNTLANSVNGPTYLEVDQIGYVSEQNKDPGLLLYPQAGQPSTGGTASPLIVGFYQCKTNNSNQCYSNYYTFTGIIEVVDINPDYYLQFGFGNGGSIMNGTGSVSISLLA